jgi:diguanylate cyclase (GGDEF)-like protein/PAS domain S-box-containing protein
MKWSSHKASKGGVVAMSGAAATDAKAPGKRKYSLRLRYISVLAPGLVAAVGLSIVVFAFDQIRTAHERLESRASRLVEITVPTVAAQLWDMDNQRVQGVLGALAAEPAFVYASVVDNKGKTIATFGRPESPESAALFEPLRYRRALARVQGESASTLIGALEVHFTQREIERDLFALILKSIAAFAVLLATLLTLTLGVTRRFVLGPVEKLIDAIRLARSGDYERVAHRESGEIGELIDAFNNMVGGLQEGEIAKDALRESEERFALAVMGSADGIWDWDARTDRAYFSPIWWHVMGMQAPDRPPVLDDWLTAIHPEDRQQVQDVFEAHRAGRTDHLIVEHRLAQSGRWVEVRGIAVRGQSGRADRIAGSMADITDRKRTEAELIHVALHDSLTGLANRMVVIDRLSLLIDRQAAGSPERVGLFFLDLDRFKTVNDTLGHIVGDNLLIQVAERLRLLFRGRYTLARLGGDEFCLIADDVGHRSSGDRFVAVTRCEEIAHSIVEAIERPFDLSGREVNISTSVGICLIDRDYLVAIDVLRDADIAMYRAKETGPGRWAVFDPNSHAAVITRLETESALRSAIRENQFEAWFQPIVDLADRTVVGFETLARWNRPGFGVVSPNQFIPLAETHGMIPAIGFEMLVQAIDAATHWRAMGHDGEATLTVAVNVSTRQLAAPDFLERVSKVIEKIGPSHGLKLEITESGLLADTSGLRDLFLRLHDFGFQLSIDDFGTGHSSLSHIDRFHFDELKIDRSFVAHIATSVRQRRLVKAILALAETMGLRVVAEGVETDVQARILTDLGCMQAQGFLFAKPLQRAEADALLMKRPVHRQLELITRH